MSKSLRWCVRLACICALGGVWNWCPLVIPGHSRELAWLALFFIYFVVSLCGLLWFATLVPLRKQRPPMAPPSKMPADNAELRLAALRYEQNKGQHHE